MAGKVYTDPAKWAAAVRRAAQRDIDKPFLKAIRKGLKPGREFALGQMRATRLGQALFGARKKPASGVVRQNLIGSSARRRSLTVFEGTLRAKGLAALIETGGKTKPHRIKAWRGRFLVFQATGRTGFLGLRRRTGIIAVPAVNHPGARVPREPFLRRSMERAAPAMTLELEKAFVEHVNQVVG
jgi:hypothetical protein